MNKYKVDWTGNFCAIVTPFKEDGQLDEGAFSQNVENLINEGIDGFVVAGCTGEFWSLTMEERSRIFQLTVEGSNGRVPVICGCVGMNATDVSAMIKGAAEAGADGVMVTPPYYVLPNEREVRHFFEDVSSTSELPILLYNIPKRQGINLSPEFMTSLADIKMIAGIKQSTGDFVEVINLIRLVGDRLRILIGHSIDRGFPGITMGGHGFVSSKEPQIMGREAIELYDASVSSDYERARHIQQKCLPLNKAIGSIGTFPSNLKYVMNRLGRPGGYTRLPLLPLNEDEEKKMEQVMKELELL